MTPDPCPFCGSENTATATRDTGAQFVLCIDCEADGPNGGLDEKGAIEAWNRRAAVEAERERCVGLAKAWSNNPLNDEQGCARLADLAWAIQEGEK